MRGKDEMNIVHFYAEIVADKQMEGKAEPNDVLTRKSLMTNKWG